MKSNLVKIIALLITITVFGCSKTDEPSPSNNLFEDAEEALSGGITTVKDATSAAFGLPAPNLSSESIAKHLLGDAGVGATFVPAPALINPGLGPLFNNNSCISCHQRDGRGRPPLEGEELNTMLFRISMTGTDENGGPKAVPLFGLQAQHKAIFGKLPEMEFDITYTEQTENFADGEKVSLRKPNNKIINPYLPIPAGMLLSARVTTPFIGLGLLEALGEKTITDLADENDRNGDGISGKANYVWDIKAQKNTLGKYGWKASQPTLLQQSAAAFEGDMGITSTLFPDENSLGQIQDVLPHNSEISDEKLDQIRHYIATLGVPIRRNVQDVQVKQGRFLFIQANCNSCHVMKLKTGNLAGLPEVSNQYIRPFTDLLLHDMGEGLTDNRPDFKATATEWRTAPLWGIGLTKIVNGHTFFLHDGRARNLTEAILWHGGEGQKSKDSFMKMAKTEREAMVKFLESL